jgi:ligand-binding sensor domain-containing protein/signal transduction histidine kinase
VKPYRWQLFLILWLGLAWLCHAQVTPHVPGGAEFLVRSWQLEDGLPDNSVKAILQTRDGFLWLGTDNGLARFDGVIFRPFNTRNTPELKSDRVRCLLEDHDGGLWIGTEGGGLTLFANQRFHRAELEGKINENAAISGLLQNEEGEIWAWVEGHGPARARCHAITGSPEQPKVALTAGSSSAGPLMMDSSGQAWSAVSPGLRKFQKGELTEYLALPDIRILARRRDGGVWLAGNTSLWALQPDGSVTDPLAYPWTRERRQISVTAVCEDRSGGLWVGTHANGLIRRDRGGAWNFVVPEGALYQNITNCIFEDREGSIWIGTEHDGLYRLNSKKVGTLMLPDTGSNTHVQSVSAARSGAIWIATAGAGVFRYQDGRFTQFGANEGLSNTYLHMVLQDSHANVWAATRGGLFRLEDDRFKQEDRYGPISGWVTCLFEDRKGRLWIGCGGGVGCFDNGKATWFTAQLANQDIRAIAEDIYGNIWVATTRSGLFRISGGQTTRYGKAEGMASKVIVALLADDEGTLWIGTYEDGLIRMRDGHFTTYSTRDGLSNDITGHLADDGNGNLWVSSVRGLMRLSKAALNDYVPGSGRQLPCLTLTRNDGLATSVCSGGSDPAMSWAADGKLLVPNMKAVAVVDAREIPVARPARPKIVEASVNGESQRLDKGDTLRMRSGKNLLEMRYTALNLATAEHTRFRVKLDGWDSDWKDAEFHRSVIYGALPPGDYRFRVMASRRDGMWDEASESYALQVVPRFWETWWFRLSVGGTAMAAVALVAIRISRRRVRSNLERLKRTHAIEQERMRIARDIHDELGAGLAQIGLMADIGADDPEDAGEIRRSFTGIGQRARVSIAALDEIVWAVNPSNDTLTRLADYLCSLTDECFETGPARCFKEVPVNLPPLPVGAEVRHNLTLAVKEALANTLKHSNASEVWLRMVWAEPELVVTVEDNGQGFDPTAIGDHGNGLANQRARLDKLGGTIEVRSEPGGGTRTLFRVRLNLH